MDELFLGIPVLYWIIGVVALVAIIAIIVIICCAVNIKKKKARAAEESISAQPAPVTYEEPSKPEPVVETAPVQEEEEVVEEKPVKAEPAKPAEKKPATAKSATAKSTATNTTATKSSTAKPAAKPSAKSEPAKPATKTYHISKRKDNNMWQIKAAGGAKAIKLFKTQKEAIDYCKSLADNQDANIMIHKEDGSFRKLTY